MSDKALEKAIEKVYEQIVDTGQVTDNQLLLIAMYNKQNKISPTNSLINSGVKILSIIDKFMSGEGVK